MKNPELPSAHTPIELAGTRITEPPNHAAGVKAVVNSLTIAVREMGPVRAAKGLWKLNQKNGFDCQSCAWPSPDEDRHLAEFCEMESRLWPMRAP